MGPRRSTCGGAACPRRGAGGAVTLEVVTRPEAAELYFWALQAGFAGPGGARLGAAHLGLPWYPAHAGSTTVSRGGHSDAGGILAGTESALPSATGNPNTCDLAWEPGSPSPPGDRRRGL
jgi:hypothetical protein